MGPQARGGYLYEQTAYIDPDKNNQVSYKVQASGLKNKETVSVFRAEYRFDKLRDGLPTFALHAAGRYRIRKRSTTRATDITAATPASSGRSRPRNSSRSASTGSRRRSACEVLLRSPPRNTYRSASNRPTPTRHSNTLPQPGSAATRPPPTPPFFEH